MYQSHYGFVIYTIWLFLFCGCFLLLAERRFARSARLKREERTCLVLGWTNIVAGAGLWVWKLI